MSRGRAVGHRGGVVCGQAVEARSVSSCVEACGESIGPGQWSCGGLCASRWPSSCCVIMGFVTCTKLPDRVLSMC